MTSKLNPYLSFNGNAREAMEFYKSVFGGELEVSTFADLNASDDPAQKDKIMHSQLVSPSDFTLMGSDNTASTDYNPGDAYSVSLSGDDDSELRGYWEKLGAGATITMPLEVAPWGDAFGMLVDKFGVTWLVNIAGSPPA